MDNSLQLLFQLVTWAKQIASGMEYLSSKQVSFIALQKHVNTITIQKSNFMSHNYFEQTKRKTFL